MAKDIERVIRFETELDASVDKAWDAWTTADGIRSFFARDCNIDISVYGKYEIYFDPSAPAGQRGAEDCKVLAYQPNKMLSFTWNSPPHLTNVRMQKTVVEIRFVEIAENKTKVILTHSGWGEGEEWDAAFEYFMNAWGNIVLPRLKYRFEQGPVDWDNLPKI